MDGLKYLESLEQWQGRGDFGLDNIRAVAKILGNPQNCTPCIHVGGTNGKGSVSAALASILGQSGKNVGLTVSPHLSTVNERIVINGLNISDKLLNECSLDLKAASEKSGLTLSFFEAITLIAFIAFAKLKLDFAVLEVGLGGRLDATNIVDNPIACAIVSVEYDHCDILGATLDKIAMEKSGILKPECMVISGRMSANALNVVAKAADKLNLKHFKFGPDYEYRELSSGLHFVAPSLDASFEIRPSLAGSHQFHNMCVAIMVALNLGIDVKDCQAGISNVFWPARLQLVSLPGVVSYLDSGHNPAGMRAIREFIVKSRLAPVEIGFGVLSTKDWREMIRVLTPCVSKWHLLSPESQSAVPTNEIADHLSSIGVKYDCFDSDYIRYCEMLRRGKFGPRVITCGSMYLIGKVRDILVPNVPPIWKRNLVMTNSVP